MTKKNKQLSNPFSTGGGGPHFEANIQAYFVALMLTGAFAPCLPCYPIYKVKLQGKFDEYDTDDMIVFVKKPSTTCEWKILAQIKHSIKITKNNKVFGEVIRAAWKDFNNVKLFSKNRDVIALITGPLSATDINDVRVILDWAKHAESADEFIRKINLTNFSSVSKRKKLKAFKSKLKEASSGKDVSDEILFEFMKHFYLLGYDLDTKTGVDTSLIHSLIGQFSQENIEPLWSQIINEVQHANKNAGTISLESLPEGLKTNFKQRADKVIPDEFSTGQLQATMSDWNQHPCASKLALTNLIGAWNENSKADIEIVHQFVKEEYLTWILDIREILQHPESPVAQKNGRWCVTERKSLWQALGKRVFDNNLDDLSRYAVTVLTERDPKFDLPSDKRYTASIYGKELKCSYELRRGMAETLALLGNQPGDLINCSQDKPDTVASLAIREIFCNADWVLWGSLNDLLPVLAEAAPEEFLSGVENSLKQTPCPFDELFLQEGTGFTGGNYITGLLWALETLAWDEIYIVRVCVILGELASHDPGGKWVNRPDNSLSTILLPWLPQTVASINKRKVALQTLQKEVPEVAWKLLLSLLPNQYQVSSGSHKPSWSNIIPDGWDEKSTQKDYLEQVSFYAELAVSMAIQDIKKLNEIVGHLGNLPECSLDKILKHLSSKEFIDRPEDERLEIWTELTKFALEHKRFSDTDWALNSEIVSKIEVLATNIAPKNPLNLHRRLFGDRDFDLYENNEDFKLQQKRVSERRQQAIEEILSLKGIKILIQFAETVESPWQVGSFLGIIAEEEIDIIILPTLLETENKKLAKFASAYAMSRQYKHTWIWVDELDKSDWSAKQVGLFLSCMPFSEETWNRATKWLKKSDKEYWSRTDVNPYTTDGDIGTAIDKLIEHKRPHAAIDCLDKILYDRKPLDRSRSVKALMAAISSTEPSYSMQTHQIVKIIKALQQDPDIDRDELFRVEWAYLPLLDRHHGASPTLLENRLASDPAFFCEVIRLIYRSKKEEQSENNPSEKNKSIATNAWKLLHGWRTPPGTQPKGVYSGHQFNKWLKQAKETCAESGHLEVALIHVGNILFYCPPAPQGLWIDQAAAEALNSKDAEDIRRGFSTEVYNSRGVHWVDPTGKPERELADQYRQKADDVENAGYQRFAVTLKSLAESYDREAERIIAEHNGPDIDNER